MGRQCGMWLIDSNKPLDLVEHIGPQDRHLHHPPQRPGPPVIPGTSGKQIGLLLDLTLRGLAADLPPQPPATPARPRRLLRLGSIAPTKTFIAAGTAIKCRAKAQIGRVPGAEAVVGRPRSCRRGPRARESTDKEDERQCDRCQCCGIWHRLSSTPYLAALARRRHHRRRSDQAKATSSSVAPTVAAKGVELRLVAWQAARPVRPPPP